MAAPSTYDISAQHATYTNRTYYWFFLFDLFEMSLYTTAVLTRKNGHVHMQRTRLMWKRLIIFALSLVVLFSASSVWAQATPKTFTFTAIPDEDTARLQQRFGKVAQYLSEALGIEVNYIPVKSYSASVAAFKNNDVQLAWFGGLSGVQARFAVPGAMAIAQGEEDTKFITYFIAHSSTGLTFSEAFPKGIVGKTFTFGSKGSTSGRLMPEFFIRSAFGKSPREVFKRVGYSGDHSKTLALVQSGSYEVGALNYKVWENEVKAGRVDESKVRVIWHTPSYPDYNWTIRGDVDQTWGEGFAAKVQQALLDIKDPDLLASFPRTRFIKADNSMYQPILDTARAIGILQK
jgi:phosphonate transport system substrate-binding protein